MEFRVDSQMGHKVFVSPTAGYTVGATEVEIIIRGFVVGATEGTVTITGAGFDAPAEG